MKRIAVLADIHSNIPALTAVAQDLEEQHVDEILVGGDLVGRGPQGTAVVEFIVARGWPCIRGNHEDYLLNFIKGNIPDEWKTSKEWSAARWMASELSEDASQFIDSLELSCRSSLFDTFRLVHGSPASYREGIGPWTKREKLLEHLDAVDEPVLVCGHTHRPFEIRLDHRMIVNVGSVGMPFNGDQRAQYAIFSSADGHDWNVEFRQVEYDQAALLEIYESSGFLRVGGVTSHFLRMEIQRARPHLVPFIKWCELTEKAFAMESVDEFLELYDETKPMAMFQLEREQEN